MIRKYWREASSIMIISKSRFLDLKQNSCNNKEYLKSEHNLNNKVKSKENSYDCKILMLKRSDKSSFMPNNYVFPGGAIASSDSSEEWLSLFKYFGYTDNDFHAISKIQAPNFHDDQNCLVPRAFSLRITAIREAFEECGVLLCRQRQQLSNSTEPVKWASYLTGHEIQKWQKKVQENSDNFIHLCKTLECFPDVWALRHWSNWLSPTNLKTRFNTTFFIATFDHLPPVFIDNTEVNDMKWCTADEYVQQCTSGEIWLPPPQFYELSRLKHFKHIDHLANFAVEREQLGCEQWMPVIIKSKDGLLTLLPGDDLYPVDHNVFDSTPVTRLDETLVGLRKSGDKLHRIESDGKKNVQIVVSNIEPSCGHMLPS